MDYIGVLNNLLDLLNSIVNLVKYLFDSNWLLGTVVGFIIFTLCIAFIFYAVVAFVLFFIYTSFQNGQYLQGFTGLLFLIFFYWYGRKNKEKNVFNENNDTFKNTTKDSFDNEKTDPSSHDTTIKEDVNSISWSYSILGCHTDDSLKNIKQAYRELAKQYHPDRFHNTPQEFINMANKKMDELNRAYKNICDTRGGQE